MTEEEFVGRVSDGLIPDELALYRAVPAIEPPVQGIWPDPAWNTERGAQAFDLILDGGQILHLVSLEDRAVRLVSDEEIS